jgi:transcription initiation factor TFIID subunit 2
VGSFDAEFSHLDPLANISFASQAEAQDCHRHPELKRKVYSALQEADEGELSVAIPREVALQQTSFSSGLVLNECKSRLYCVLGGMAESFA